MPRRSFASDARAFLGVALALAALIGLGALAQRVSMASARARTAALQQAQVEAATRDAAAQLQRAYDAMLQQARALADDANVQQALRRLPDEGPDALARQMASLHLDPYGSVEIFASTAPEPVAWQGPALLPVPPPATPPVRTVAFVEDGTLRSAVVLYEPIRDGAVVVGGVRVKKLLRYTPPVQNTFLKPYALLRSVETRTRTQIALHAPGGAGTIVRGSDGTPLVSVEVTPPPAETVLRAERRRFIDVKAFWATLLGGWLVWGLWRMYRRASERGAHRSPWRVASWFALWAAGLAGYRAALLALDMPGRWQVRQAPLSPLFDPTHLASTYGWGMMRSLGDALVTTLFLAVLAVAFVGLLRRLGVLTRLPAPPPSTPLRRLTALVLVTAMALLQCGCVVLLARAARYSVLDSTLNLFDRTGLVPAPLVLVTLCALLLATAALLLVGTGLWALALRGVEAWGGPLLWLTLAGTCAVTAGVVALVGWRVQMPPPLWGATAVFLFAGLVLALALRARRRLTWADFTLRRVLVGVMGLTALLYPLLYDGMDAQRRLTMADAAATFDDSRDPRALFALRQPLERAAATDSLTALLRLPADSTRRARLDAAAADLVRTTLLGSLGAYDVTLLFFQDDAVVGRYSDADGLATVAVEEARDRDDFLLLRAMHRERGGEGPTIEPVTGERDPDRFQYIGLYPLDDGAWVLARAEPQIVSQDLATPFPRVLLPSGYGNGYERQLAVALFRDDVLVRGLGRDFGRYRLDDDVQRRLRAQPVLWRTERVRGEPFTTRYQRQPDLAPPDPSRPPTGTLRVVAVRVAALSLFDHLFFLLRLTLAGLLVGVPLWTFSLAMRRRMGLLPPPRQRFQDRVLNAFLGVGILSVMAVGLVGLGVLTGENERAVESWLRQHLERVEETLALDALPGELPYQVLERTPLDSLARRVGLDLNVYREGTLVATSRPALVRDGLIDTRLPGDAYRNLVYDGYRFTSTEERVGRFRYTAGFRALPDEQGRPRYVLSVPTLPEQERIEEEQARMVAYLFGALLLLLLIVLATALVLARALARPIARLREGLRNVARGQFQTTIPVPSRDEIGDLVQTFNDMQRQLAESRRQLAQQERQLAWREMARQVAHEIKNPLTPMKLSIQHLRRAFDDLQEGESARQNRFGSLFDRVTRTLIEQTDALARIAGDFSSFARLPRRVLEPLDLNTIVEEAAGLMQEEEGAEITLDLALEPLVVEGDHEELRRVYINLIKNAIQASTDRAEKRVYVATTRGADGREAVSTVEDRGTGIPEALRGRIFEPNFSTKTSGTGLGLAIVRKAVEESGGHISFETEEGVGTTFRIVLPLAGEE